MSLNEPPQAKSNPSDEINEDFTPFSNLRMLEIRLTLTAERNQKNLSQRTVDLTSNAVVYNNET